MLRLARAKVTSDVPTQVDRCVPQDIAVALLGASSRQTCKPPGGYRRGCLFTALLFVMTTEWKYLKSTCGLRIETPWYIHKWKIMYDYITRYYKP